MGSQYIITGTTDSSTTAGAAGANTALAVLAASGKIIRLVSLLIDPQNGSGTQTPGRWVVDIISALGAVGSAAVLTPAFATTSRAAAGSGKYTTDFTVVPTSVTAAAVPAAPGWNHFAANGIIVSSGASQGFALRRAVAPSGAQVVNYAMVIEED